MNIRRHTRLKRLLRSLCLGAACVALPVCCVSSPGVPSRARIVVASTQPSAVPSIEKARQLSAEDALQRATASSRVDDTSRGLKSSQEAIQGLVAEVSRLHEQKSANESDLLKLYNQLVEQEKKFGLMVMQLSDASAALENGRQLGRHLSEALVASQALAAGRDTENTQLRSQLLQSETDKAAAKEDAVRNSKLAAANAARADSSRGTIKVLLWICLGLSGLIAAYVLTRLYLPRIPIP